MQALIIKGAIFALDLEGKDSQTGMRKREFKSIITSEFLMVYFRYFTRLQLWITFDKEQF